MINTEITKELLISFTGALLALLSAGIIWFLKSAYGKHKSEIFALAKFERIFAMNLTLLKDNFEFLDEWLKSLKNNRPYSCHFADYLINEEETYKLSNLKLINKILSLNYKLHRTSLDFNNIYKSYWEVIFKIDSIGDEVKRENNLKIYHGNTSDILQKMISNYEPLKNNIIDVIALIRAVHKVRKHSLFGYLSFLFRDLFPRISEKTIEKEKANLLDNIKTEEKTGE